MTDISSTALFDNSLPHYQALELLAADALTNRDYARAFKFADRRCRIPPHALAHCFVLRAEALHGLGDIAGARRDINNALEIDPDHIAAARRALAWGSDEDRLIAAKVLIANDDDSSKLRTSIDVLQDAGTLRTARILCFQDNLTGWASWCPGDRVTIDIRSQDGAMTAVIPPATSFSLATHLTCANTFRIFRPESHKPQQVTLAANGEVFYSKRVAPNAPAPKDRKIRKPDHSPCSTVLPTVVVPVFGDFPSTSACIESLLIDNAISASYRILIVNDASPDSDIVNLLYSMQGIDRLTILHNDTNVGFIGSINKALAQISDGDVLLLNSDTIVPPGFFDRMASTAYNHQNVGTIVPLSNNGGIADFPRPFEYNSLGSYEEIVTLDKIAAIANHGEAVELPNGTGFCLYITRDCLRSVGELSESLERGYLEDIEFCLRAREKGFRNVCATSVYVGHAGSRSFKEDKRSLVVRNLDIVNRRFPRFRTETAAYLAADPLRRSRQAMECLRPTYVRGPTLILIGEARYKSIGKRRFHQLILSTKSAVLVTLRLLDGHPQVVLTTSGDESPHDLCFDLSYAKQDQLLIRYLEKLDPAKCEVIGLTSISNAFVKILDGLDISFDVLVAGTSGLKSSLASDSTEYDASVRNPSREDDYNFRGATYPLFVEPAELIRAAERILVPCSAASEFIRRAMPHKQIVFTPLPLAALPSVFPSKADNGRPILAIFSPIPSAEGFRRIRAVALHLHHFASDVSIVVVGTSFDDRRLLTHPNLFITGEINCDQIAMRLAPHNVKWILTGLDSVVFELASDQFARNAKLPVAFFDWSMGSIPPRPRDLAISPSISLDNLADAISTWMKDNY